LVGGRRLRLGLAVEEFDQLADSCGELLEVVLEGSCDRVDEVGQVELP
jgi:hypothetical protein